VIVPVTAVAIGTLMTTAELRLPTRERRLKPPQ
jgi:hypothetical protein